MRGAERWGFLLTRLASSAGQAVMLIVLARTAPAETLGAVTAVTGIAIFAVSLLDFGLTTAMLKFVAAGNPRESAAALRLTVMTTPLLPIVTAGATIAMGLGVGALAIFCLALWSAAEKLIEVAICLRVGSGSLRSASLFTAARRLAPLIAQVLFLVAGVHAVTSYAGGLLLGSAVVLLCQVKLIQNHWGSARGSLRSTWRSAWPMYLAAVSTQSRELEVPLVGWLVSPAAAAGYALGFRLSRPVSLIGSAIAQVTLADAAKTGTSMVPSILRQSYIIASLGVLVSLGSVSVLEDLLVSVAGQAYAGVGWTAAFLFLAASLAAATMPLGAALQALGFAGVAAAIAVTASLLCIICVSISATLGTPSVAACAVAAVCALRFVATAIAMTRLRSR